MTHALLSWFEWCQATAVGQVVHTTPGLFPVIEALHLVALSAFGGALLVVDLRMLGAGLTSQPLAALSTAVHPWLVSSLALLAVSGIPLFMSEAVKCYHIPSFWVKLAALPPAILFTFTVRRRVAADSRRDTSATTRAVATVSLVLWFIVAAAARWIGFSS